MTSPFTNAIGHALDTVRGVAGVQVTYHRGEDSVTIQQAVRGSSQYEADDGRGLVTEVQVEDFLIPAAGLVLGGLATEPEDGDRIEQVVGAKRLTYEVMAPSSAETAWRYSDTTRTTLRIHTKLIKTEDAAP